MAELNYLIDPEGKVVASSPEDTAINLATGYLPAGAKQIEDFKKEQAFHAKYGTPGQQIATGAEAAASALTFGLSPLVERGLGVPAEDIRARKEENPTAHTVGTIAGVAAPLIATAGTSGAVSAAEAGVKAALKAGEGVEAAEAALSAAKAAAAANPASYTAPALISKLGEGSAKVAEHLIGEPATALGRVLSKAATAGASGWSEGNAYGLGQVMDEASMGDPHLTASHALEEVGLSGLLGFGIGGTTGVLSGLIGEAASGKLGQKISDWADTFEGNQNIKTAAGPGKGQAALRSLFKKMSPEQASAMGREAGDMGLIGPLDKPATVFEKSGNLMEEVGPKIDEGIKAVDALEDVKHPSVGDVVDRLKENVVKPLDVVGGDEGLVSRISDEIQGYEDKLGGRDAKLSFEQMNDIRRNINKRIYGLNGDLSVSTAYKDALRDLAHGFGDEVEKGIEASGKEFAPIQALNRQYSVAATMNRISEKGMAAAGLSGVPLTAIMSGLTGLVHGGPLGAAVLGGGAMLAKRYGPQVLAAAARGARNLVDEEAAAGLASKTADAISASREAASEAGAATRASALWGKLGQKLEAPVVAPGKDLARDMAQEHMGHEGTPVETVAALSHLEAANQRVNERVTGLAKKLVSGESLKSATRGAAEAVSAEQMAQELEHVHRLAGNQDALLQHVTAQNEDLHQHAPDTAQALSVVSSRAVNYFHGKFPAPPRTPLGKPPKANKNDLWKYNRVRDVTGKSSNLLKHAAKGTLIPDQVEAVAAIHPEALKAMQSAVLNELASAKTVSHTSRMMASVLLGQPLDPGMSQQAIALNQAVFNRPSAKSGEDQLRPMGKPTQGGMAKLNVSGHAMLPGQAVESRRSEA